MHELVLGYSPLGNGHSIFPFDAIFDRAQNIEKSIEGVDAVVFWGGTDIHPSLYSEPPHRTNQVRTMRHPSARDEFEKRAMLYCKAKNIPIIGICRGAQLMCALAGGSLVQDCDGHHGNHMMTTEEGETIETTSCHHQMMVLEKVPHRLLAWSSQKRSKHYKDGYDTEIAYMKHAREPEVVYFPTMHGLAIQGHPEWADKSSRFVQYVNELIISLLVKQTVLEV